MQKNYNRHHVKNSKKPNYEFKAIYTVGSYAQTAEAADEIIHLYIINRLL